MFRPALASTLLHMLGADDAPQIEWGQIRMQNEAGPAGLSPQQALIYAVVAAAAVDRQISRVELERINSMVGELPAFRGLEENWFVEEGQRCGRLLARPDGLATVLRSIGRALSLPLRETAYALAAEVTGSDLALRDAERRFLDLLAAELGIDDLLKAALDRAVQVRHHQL